MVAQARIAVAFCSVLLSLIECQNLKSYDRRQVEELPPPNYNVSTANVPDQWSCFSPNFLGLRERPYLNTCYLDTGLQVIQVRFYLSGGSMDIPRNLDPQELNATFVEAIDELNEEALRTHNAYMPAPLPLGSDFGEAEFHHGNLGVHVWSIPCHGIWTVPDDDDPGVMVDYTLAHPRYSSVVWTLLAAKAYLENRNRPDNRGFAEFNLFTGPHVGFDEIDWTHDVIRMGLTAWQTLGSTFSDAGLLPYDYNCDPVQPPAVENGPTVIERPEPRPENS